MHSISRAIDHLLRATGDPIRDLDGIGPDHPGHLHAEVIRAAVGVLAKVPAALPAVSRAAREAHGAHVPPRLRAHLEAARLWVHGDAVLAAQGYAEIVRRWPRDLLAMRLVQSCYFFVGQPEKTCAVIDAAIKKWPQHARGRGFLLAMASFAHAECDHASRAEQLGREALAHDPSCPMGVHAVAHAIAQSGRPGDGARWMRSQRAQWSVQSRMRTHNAWHLAMFDLDDGQTALAMRSLDTCLLPAAQASPVDACDVTTLLWRLAAMGLDVENRWRDLSDAFERMWQPGFWPYVDMHAAITHLRAGHRLRLDRLTRSVELCAAEENPTALRARTVTMPFLRAIDDWAGGEQKTLVAAKNLNPLLLAAGGSRMQMEIFTTAEVDHMPRANTPSSVTHPRFAGEHDVDHYRQTH